MTQGGAGFNEGLGRDPGDGNRNAGAKAELASLAVRRHLRGGRQHRTQDLGQQLKTAAIQDDSGSGQEFGFVQGIDDLDRDCTGQANRTIAGSGFGRRCSVEMERQSMDDQAGCLDRS